MATKIWFVAGVSGGHIIPCLTLAQQQKKQNSTLSVCFFSTNTPTDKAILEGNDSIDLHVTLPLKRVPRSLMQYPRFILQFFISFFKSLYYMTRHRPTLLISSGGVVAIPVCIAARVLRIPVHLYELNAIPGKAITKLAPLAHKIFYCFASTKNYFPDAHSILTSYPMRNTLQDQVLSPQVARTELGLSPNKKTVCVLGGSQGSQFLNNFIKEWVSTHHNQDVQIIHQTGTGDTTDWHTFYANNSIPAYVFSFRRDIARCYQAADLIICRAGAGTIFEVKFFEKQCILIPLETGSTSHQVDNAYAIAKENPDQFTVIEQELAEKNKELVNTTIQKLLYGFDLPNREFASYLDNQP